MKITAVLHPNGTQTQEVQQNTGELENFSTYLEEEEKQLEPVQKQLEPAEKVVVQDEELKDIFQEAADTYHVPVSLLTAMAKQESNFRSDATSSSGAMGIMQLMPNTAAALGCENPYDARENIMAGAKYISQLLGKYNNNVSLALAAYNAGSGNVDKYQGIPPFEETQNYVEKVTGYMNNGDGTDTFRAVTYQKNILQLINELTELKEQISDRQQEQ